LVSLDGVIEQKKSFIANDIGELEKEKRAGLDLRLQQETSKYEKLIEEVKKNSEISIAEWTEKAEDAREKYLSVMETLRAEEESDETHMLQLPQTVRDDMSYLVETVVPRLNNKEVVNKLIWSEYIQSPTKDMLDAILPSKECPGIYKITNMNTKKSYIGRSTNVYKRLQDHIKSSCGIATIAD
jgi:excinuclease UvrABC nuclease subunit